MKEVSDKIYNILYTTSFGDMIGGGQWSLYYLIRHLNQDNFHPIVVCPHEGELAEKMREVGADVLCLNVGRIRYLNPFVIWKFISIIRSRNIALIHTDSSTETFYAGIAARITGIPLIWHVRVSEHEWLLDRILSLFSTRLVLVANAISRRFSWLKDSHKMLVIHNGINLDEFDNFSTPSSIRDEFNIGQNTVLLGCIGRIEERKGQEYLISAMRLINCVKLILVGAGEKKYIKKIKNLCNEFNILNRVIHVGYRYDISSLLKEIDILVFPTIAEGFSRIILEAMAAAIPVIATDVGGNSEAVENGLTGFIIPIRNPDVLAARINELVDNKEKRATMGRAGRKRAEELFTIQHNVKRIEDVYCDIIK